jgi:hypothetical protein
LYAISEGSSVFLVGTALERFEKAADVYEAALQALDELSAIISLLWPNLIRPNVRCVYREDDSGERKGHMFAPVEPATLRLTGRATATINGKKPTGPTQAQQLLAASRNDSHLQIATLLWADPLRTWPRLFRILEEIERFLGVPVNQAGFCSDNQRQAFRRSANSAEIAGKDSRHAQGMIEPPQNPMTFKAATEFTRQMLEATLRRASVSAGVATDHS